MKQEPAGNREGVPPPQGESPGFSRGEDVKRKGQSRNDFLLFNPNDVSA